jgi:hypothetical protein
LVWTQPETVTLDADGNLTSDSLWTNRWDAENRRTVIETRAAVPPAAQRREQWTFLPDGRWIERIVSTNNGTAYFPAFTNRYVWDGQVLLAVLDGENIPVVTLMRGLDLSATMQGAGGVRGLLAVSLRNEGTHFVCYDGNGNVVALVNAADNRSRTCVSGQDVYVSRTLRECEQSLRCCPGFAPANSATRHTQGDLSLEDHNESSFRMSPSPHTRRTAVPLAVWQDCNRTGRSNRKGTGLFFR